MCISSSPSLRANVMSFSFVENAHQKLFLGCQVILDLTLNCAIRCSAHIRAVAGGKLGTQSSSICWMRSFRGPSTKLTIQSFKKVSTKSTRSSRIQSRGPRPETSMSMWPTWLIWKLVSFSPPPLATSISASMYIPKSAMFAVEAPTAHYDASAEFMGIGVSAGITANIADFGIYIDAEMDIANGGGLQLTNFAISHVGHIDIDVSGLGPLDWILELLVDFVDTFLKDWIVSLVEGPLKDLIQQLLDEYVPDFPPSAIV